MRYVKWGMYGGSVVVVGWMLGWLGWIYVPPVPPRTLVAQASQKVAELALTAHTGTTVRLRDLRGKVVVVFFGYTACPDVCTQTLSNIAEAVHHLGQEAKQIQVLMLSVDPGHDTPAVLTSYMSAFDPTFLGLTAPPATVKAIATTFGGLQAATPPAVPTQPVHSANVIVLDQRGYLRLRFPAGASAPDVAADLAAVLRGALS